MDCVRKCFLHQNEPEDDSYYQPVNRANKRHVSTLKQSTMGRRPSRASRASIDVKDLSDRGQSIRRSDLVHNLDEMDIDDLDNPKYDDDTFDNFHASDERESELNGRDSIVRSLPSIDKKVTVGGENLIETTANKILFASSSLMKFAKRSFPSDDAVSSDASVTPKLPAITSIAALSNGFFLTASVSKNIIAMHKTVGEKVEFVREFNGHTSGITALVTLDRKGRFLSAGIDRTVILWDSRFDINEESAGEAGMENKPMTLLATFCSFNRYVHSIGVIDEGSFVRPTDDIDMAMVTAMAKKTALEGAASVQRAAILREIIECSGSFASSSKNDRRVQIWSMSVVKDDDDNAAKISLVHELEHDTSIVAMSVAKTQIITGDAMGVVHMWECHIGYMGLFGKKGGNWTKKHKFMPWKESSGLHTVEQTAQQSIRDLCFLSDGTFVSGTKSGVLRVWPEIESIKEFDVNKKQASSVKVTSKSVTCIQKLQPVQDPNTGEKCMAFSVGFADGRMVSMALYPQDPSEKGKSEIVMFHVYSNSPTDDSKRTAINSIALLEDLSGSSDDSSGPILVAGDENGSIQTLKPRWSSAPQASLWNGKK